jgi:hypothetical protein
MSHQKARVVIVAPLLITLGLAASEEKVPQFRGVITDGTNGPIPNAAVELVCTQKGKKSVFSTTKSLTDGHFQLEGKPSGTCSIVFAAQGFAPKHVRITKSREETDLGKIQLKLSCSTPGTICDEIEPAGAKQKGPGR